MKFMLLMQVSSNYYLGRVQEAGAHDTRQGTKWKNSWAIVEVLVVRYGYMYVP